MEPPASGSFYTFILFLISLFFCALFSFIETAIISTRLFKIKEFAQNTKKYNLFFETLEHQPNKILITILIAYNLANVVAAILNDSLIQTLTEALNIPANIGFILSIIISSTVILLADLLPKSLATQRNDKLFQATIWITNVLFIWLRPFVNLLSRFTDNVTTAMSGRNCEVDVTQAVASEQEIKFLIDYINEKGLMESHKTSMLLSIFELSNRAVKEVMMPASDIVSIDADSTQEEVLDVFNKYHFTRLPVYDGNEDNIIGLIHQKDFFTLLSKNQPISIRDIVRPMIFIPESAILSNVLKDLREKRIHIAMVINEFGGIIGLVTLEDIIEEIVGEIIDEYESTREKIISLKSGGWLIDASIELKEISNLLNVKMKSEDALTLGGFIAEHFHYVPKKNEEFNFKGYTFQIQQASPKRIYQVLIFPAPLEQLAA